jgi:hypothetical protein
MIWHFFQASSSLGVYVFFMFDLEDEVSFVVAVLAFVESGEYPY